ncbi:MAG: methylenetetrahydrofolate reductase [Clostridiales bacterium]|nr:methylenetetrahydrofolate reductase [Clostridiales bacterium]MCF8021953.1 methylenetetrahydrofolate reductase [Clostridiales bacterium]
MNTNSHLEKVFNSGEFVVSAEIGPPKHASAEGMHHYADVLRDYVDAANITDNQTAVVRISSIAGGVHLNNKNVCPIIQMTCRDRNRIAMQADLLGAYSLGINTILCLSGDHQIFGNHPTSKNVYDIDSMHLIQTVRKMRDEKQFMCGEEIKNQEPRFFVGAVANPFGDPFEFRVDRLEKKVEAGAEFIQTQCIFDMERFERYMEEVCRRGIDERVHIMAGITPLKSWKAARYIGNNVGGMIVPDEIVERLKGAEDQKAEGLNIAVEQINHVKKIKGVHGVHIMAIAWEEKVPEIVERCGLYPRPKFD